MTVVLERLDQLPLPDHSEPAQLAVVLERLASAQEDMASQLPRALRKLDRISKAVDLVADATGHAEGRPDAERADSCAESRADSPRSPRGASWVPPLGLRSPRLDQMGSDQSDASARGSARGHGRDRELQWGSDGPGGSLPTSGLGLRSGKTQDFREDRRCTIRSTRGKMTDQAPDAWPWSLEPRNEWADARGSLDEGRLLRRTMVLRNSRLGLDPTPSQASQPSRAMSEGCDSTRGSEVEALAPVERSRFRFVIDPTSRFHMIYNLICLSFIAYDLIVLPYYVAWEVDLSQRAMLAAAVTAVWWLIDFVLNFTTAYHANGTLVWNRASIRAHYVRTWFVPDLLLVVIDTACVVVILLAASGSTPASRVHPFYVARLARMARILRVASALRILKSAKVVKDYLEKNALSESWQLYTKVASSFLISLLATHWAACGWYAVGELPSDTGNSWTQIVRDHKWFYQYATAFHFAVAELTLGGTEIACETSAERLYNCVLLMLGLLFGSSLVSGLSASMVQAQMDHKERRVKLRTLQQFMRYHEVLPAMARRVKQQAVGRMRATRRVQYESVTILKDLSASLVSELRFHICMPHISTHGLFRIMVILNHDISEKICAQAVKFQGLMCQDDLFASGDEAGSAYAIVDGILTYSPGPWVVQDHSEIVKVQGGSWLAEAALWSKWIHVGKATAVTECTVLALLVDKMTMLVQRDSMLQRIMSGYCMEFHARLTDKDISVNPPTDLLVSRTSFDEVVTNLDDDDQRVVYQAALNHAIEDQAGNMLWQHKVKLPMLQEEVDQGKSGVLLNAKGDPYRVVRKSTGRIELDDGRVLVELGRIERLAAASPVLSVGKLKLHSPSKSSSRITCVCNLPSLMSDFAETPRMTWERMIVDRLEGLADSIEITGQEYVQEWVDSPELGVHTLRQNVIFNATVSNEDEHFGDVFLPRNDVAGSANMINRTSKGSTGNMSCDSGRTSTSTPTRPSWFGFAAERASSTESKSVRHGKGYWESILADPATEKEFQESIILVREGRGKEVYYRWTPPTDLEQLIDRQDRQSKRALHVLLSRFDKRLAALKFTLPAVTPSGSGGSGSMRRGSRDSGGSK